MKYEVVCSIGKPRIIWFDGPWKVTVPDCTISRRSQLRVALSGNERLLADKGYINAPNYFICPVTGKSWTLNSEDKTRNYMIYCARQTVERLFSRIKKFGFWHIPWRASIGLHGLCARVTAKSVNFYFLSTFINITSWKYQKILEMIDYRNQLAKSRTEQKVGDFSRFIIWKEEKIYIFVKRYLFCKKFKTFLQIIGRPKF